MLVKITTTYHNSYKYIHTKNAILFFIWKNVKYRIKIMILKKYWN